MSEIIRESNSELDILIQSSLEEVLDVSLLIIHLREMNLFIPTLILENELPILYCTRYKHAGKTYERR